MPSPSAFVPTPPISQDNGPRNWQRLATEIEQQRERVRALELAVAERKRLEQQRLIRLANEKKERRRRRFTEATQRAQLDNERKRALFHQQDEQRRRDRQIRDESAMRAHLRHEERLRARFHQQEEQRHRDREHQDDIGMRAYLRHEAITQARRNQQKSLTQERILAFEGPVPSFLDEEFQYMKQASTTFPEVITPSIQMSCMKAYQKAISDASRRLPCGLCGGLFQEEEVLDISLQDANLLHFFEKTGTEPDCCAVKDDSVGLCSICSSAVAKQAIPPLSAGNFTNCLFCQDYPAVLKNLNTIEEAFIARAHVIGMFLKLTSGAQRGISYRGSRGHCVAVRQDPSQLLRILPARRLQDHTTITVS